MTTNYFNAEEIKVINKFGLNPDSLEKLIEPDTIIVYDIDVESDFDADSDDILKGAETEDFGISIDTENEDIEIWISGYDEKISENDRLLDEIKDMCKCIECGAKARDVWYDYTFKLSL